MEKINKEISFLQAVKELNEGKNVICKINGISKIYQSKKAKMIDSGNKAISYNETLNGKWFLFH